MSKSIATNVVTTVKPSKIITEAGRHAKRALWKHFSLSQYVFAFTIAFLFLPLLVLVVFSFNSTASMNWTGFSLRWYEGLMGSRELWRALKNSLIIAVTSAATATVIGTMGAIGVSWYKFKTRAYVQTISFLPMILPEIIIGVSLTIFFAGVGIKLGLLTIYIAHVTFNLPFVFLMVMARLDEFDFSIIEAAKDLGASERDTLFKITLPICMPGIISGLLTAITLSLEDFVITFFVAGPGSTTLPIYIFSSFRRPDIRALVGPLSVVMIVGTVLLCIFLRKFLKYIAAK